MNPLPFDWNAAAAHVAAADPRLGRVIAACGDARLVPRTPDSPFHSLARAIIYQQLSGKAAGTIHNRLLGLFERRRMTPRGLLALGAGSLRAAGVSANKQKALKDLARRALDGEVPGFARLRGMDDEAIIEQLTRVHGIGRWTVEMLLIFDLGRPDVLPLADLGVRRGLMLAHGMKSLPAAVTLARRAAAWAPFRTVGSWYCWRACELQT
ncbi:MAG: DNA-3-methyladenine glycosylase 2 family protein [Planctomycetes bacterium]|jgi:3-methyladenine DNA glycosylase/8-oxoguanine DNA glycosylase|nr:DNA-3-methyladenine glycosylase 2 family protein [Planctomycetota bacterium]MCL4729894.1 DNA-3-methyladenine glycosylase 2 family protein [Planctomycetota bacterium]